MPRLNRLPATRIAATPAALDSAAWPVDSLALRLAPDEVLIIPPVADAQVADPHAIVVPDSSFAGVWVGMDDALEFLARTCEWELPNERPTFTQGMVAGIPAKLWVETDRVLIIVPSTYVADFEERMR